MNIVNQPRHEKFGIGQTLYFNVPFFCDPNFIIRDWHNEMLSDYYLTKNFNIPLSKDIDSANAWKSDCFLVIENEIQRVAKFKQEENG